MSGQATRDGSLVDGLFGLADTLRASLNTAMGVRQWHVDVVRRRWNGGERGAGTPSVTSRERLTPDPEVLFDMQGAFAYEMRSHGRDLVGDALLREISLSYTEEQLTGGTIAGDEDFFFKLTDAHGQQLAPRFFVAKAPPIADRVKRIGWQVTLEAVEIKRADVT